MVASKGATLNQITRRVAPPALDGCGDVQHADVLVPRIHRDGPLQVESQVVLGVEPQMSIQWSVPFSYWAAGYTLYLFRSDQGFCPEREPSDLNRHGRLVAEARRDDVYAERPPEGTFYYTCVLHKPVLFGYFERQAVVRFSELVPSGKVALGRLGDQAALADLIRRQELAKVAHEADLGDAELRRLRVARALELAHAPPADPEPEPPPVPPGAAVLAAELERIDALVEAAVAFREKSAALRADPRFQALPKGDQRRLLKELRQRLDPAELSAAREQHGA